MTKRIPLVLKFDDWPVEDKRAWDALFDAEDIFSDTGTCMHWSEGSRRKRAQSYGQWLSFLWREGPEALAEAPGARLTEERTRKFLAECDSRLAPRSPFGLLSDLYQLMKHIAPENDLNWLKSLVNRLRLRADAASLPEAHGVTAQSIWSWSIGRLVELEQDAMLSPELRAIRFRQALMIGFLIARPYRRRALLGMKIDTHLRAQGESFSLHFAAEDMKDRRARTAPFPAELAPAMRRYLEHHRLELLDGRTSDHLWISQYGEPITADGLSRELPKVTMRHFGVALRPHAFRHIAATSIAETAPKHVGIIRDILGHAMLDMSQKHYNRATGITSCDAYQDVVSRILDSRSKVRPEKHLSGPRGPKR